MMKKLLVLSFILFVFVAGCSSSPASSEPDFISGEWKTSLNQFAMAPLKQKADIPLGQIKIRLDSSKMTATIETYGDKETYHFDFAVISKKDYSRVGGTFGPGELYGQDKDECGFLYVFSLNKDAANIEAVKSGKLDGVDDNTKVFTVFFDFGTFRSQPTFCQLPGNRL